MSKKSRRAASGAAKKHHGRASRGKDTGVMRGRSLLAGGTTACGVTGILAFAAATTVAGVAGSALMIPTASASTVIGGCLAPQTNCAAGKASSPAQTTAGRAVQAAASGPQLAPLPPPPPVNARSISAVPDRPIAAVVTAAGGGYRLIGSAGGVYSFGTPDSGSLLGHWLNGRIVGAASSGSNLWLAGSDGGVFTFGGAPFLGSMGATRLNGPVVGVASTPSGNGYYLVGRDGGIFTFGDAHYFGSMGGKHLNGAIVGMAVDPATGGYWLVGSDGGIFSFNAPYLGSMGAVHLNGRIVGMAATPTGNGYYLVGSDGGIFTFGDAHYLGSTGGHHLAGSIAGIAPTSTGNGYWLAGTDGGIFTFGDAPFLGSAVPVPPPPPPPPVPIPPPAPVGPTSLVVPSGATGVDISRYQCGAIPPAHYAISVVQVTGGALNWPANPCFAAEAGWAGPDLQTYIYMDGLPNPVPAEAANGPAGTCGNNAACLGYNYGFFWAQHWVGYATSLGFHPKQWWLDVETGSAWTDPGTNDQIIRGAMDALHASGAQFGIYSNPRQWNIITGGWSAPGVQIWVPGAGNLTGPGYTATAFCGDPSQRFAGGVLRYVQYGYTGAFPGSYGGPATRYDLDFAC